MVENHDRVTIHKAAADGKGGLCEELLTKGEDVNSTDQLGWTPLMHAAHNGHTLLVRDLLSHGAQVSLCNHHGITTFTMAACKFEKELIATLYKKLSPELRQQESNMALLVACCNGSDSTVKWLLQNTLAQVNCVSPLTGVTPLMMVAMGSGSCKVAELLLESGADSSMTTALGEDVADLALANGYNQLYLLVNSASPKRVDCFNFRKIKTADSEGVEPMFTMNQLHLDIQGHVVLKNSPARPVFKTKNYEEISPVSTQMKSVFLSSPRLNCEYSMAAIVTPRKSRATPNKGKNRKISTVSSISSWLKKVTKRRSKSLADEDDYNDLNILQRNGVDFLKLLKSLELEEFFPIFKGQELDIWTFLSLTAEDLAAMGINKASSQIRILAGIQTLKTTQI